jgi:hypothetical protein
VANEPSYLVRDGVCEFRPRGEYPLSQTLDLFVAAIAFCKQQHVDKLLIDATLLVGPLPSRLDRFLIGEELARAGRGAVAVAFLARAESIGEDKLGRSIAKDSGMSLEAFSSEAEALAWLRRVGSGQSDGGREA